MKRKYFLVVLFLILAIFLSGCSDIYNLNYFVVPDDIEFLTLVEELDTPRKISNYMLENFTFELHEFYTPDPYILWQIKEGDCNDFATFGMFIANWHDYETYMIKIYYSDTYMKHAIAVYVEDDGLSITDTRVYFNNDGLYFDTFKEIVDWDCNYVTLLNWRKYIVRDYWDNEVEVGYNY